MMRSPIIEQTIIVHIALRRDISFILLSPFLCLSTIRQFEQIKQQPLFRPAICFRKNLVLMSAQEIQLRGYFFSLIVLFGRLHFPRVQIFVFFHFMSFFCLVVSRFTRMNPNLRYIIYHLAYRSSLEFILVFVVQSDVSRLIPADRLSVF